jgi:hypothetical protein
MWPVNAADVDVAYDTASLPNATLPPPGFAAACRPPPSGTANCRCDSDAYTGASSPSWKLALFDLGGDDSSPRSPLGSGHWNDVDADVSGAHSLDPSVQLAFDVSFAARGPSTTLGGFSSRTPGRSRCTSCFDDEPSSAMRADTNSAASSPSWKFVRCRFTCRRPSVGTGCAFMSALVVVE